MKAAVITSTKDPAGRNIKSSLLRISGWEKQGFLEGHEILKKGHIYLYTTDKDSIYCENIDKDIDADLIMVASKHSSSEGKPSLSVHPIGNWGKAVLGGRDSILCTAPAPYIRAAYLALLRIGAGLPHEITVESTHHGPYIEKPVMFIEIGSSIAEWENPAYGDLIAKTILEVLSEERKAEKTAIVLGAGHYNQAANKVMQKTGIAVGHMCPKYALGELTKEMLLQAIEKHTTKVDTIILDWKGLGGHKEKVKGLLEGIGIDILRLKDL